MTAKAIRVEAANLSRGGAKSILGAAEWLGISEREVWRLIGAGLIITCRHGKRRLVPVVSLQRYLESLIVDRLVRGSEA